MPNDPNAAELSAASATPSAVFPLAGTVRSAPLFVVDPQPVPTISTAVTRAWGAADPTKILHNEGNEQSLFPPSHRTAALEIQVPPYFDVELASIFSRQWNGIGGTGYLPSFPQWDRKVTTYPMAH